jgi:hypothetical protein
MRSALTRPVSAILFLLIWVGLVFPSGCFVEGGAARPQAAGRTSDSVHKQLDPVLGRGIRIEDARKDALEKARLALNEYFQELDPPLEWRPSSAYIQKRLFKGEPERLQEEDQGVAGHTVKCWRWKLAISSEDWYDIQRRDRKARVDERLLILARVLAGLVAVLAVIAGYIRADDWTKGYYTGWLRAGAVAVVALAGGMLWWLS